uniref:Uncharacterized protein n=1 Tax=Ananas comosus var. bracteatus TaxID=296719 RepID=A0A6V7Q6B5_ANACO|nr:unnamed protein product [Ananas comosus var. bracteatus]
MERSTRGWESRSERGIPTAAAWAAVLSEVGMPTTSRSAPRRRSSPSRSSACAAVEPVPSPTTIPDSTCSTARCAAIRFCSSWLSPVPRPAPSPAPAPASGCGGDVVGGFWAKRRWGGGSPRLGFGGTRRRAW